MRKFSCCSHSWLTSVCHARVVNEARSRLLALRDDSLPALQTLLAEPEELLSVALAIEPTSAQLRQLHWQPGRSLTAVYEIRVKGNRAAGSAGHVVATTGS